jgi:adenosylhomocysteine nucleosidase
MSSSPGTLTFGRPVPGEPLFVVAARAEATAFDHALPVLVTGIGKIRAAAALAACLAAYESAGGLPSAVVNIGTAGALGDHMLGVHRVETVLLHDFSHSAVRKITGVDEYPPLHVGPRDAEGTATAEPGTGVVLATGDTFVADSAVRDALAEQADLVDMEGYAIAQVAHDFGVPVELIKHVSDSADETSGDVWTGRAAELAEEIAGHARSRASR